MEKELQRVVRYAQGLGLTVSFKPYKRGTDTGGEYIGDAKEIVIYRSRRDSQTSLILILLHELGHHLDYIYKGKRDSKRLEKALKAENAWKKGDPPIPKYLRQEIFESEVNGTRYMSQIARELDLKVPLWKVGAEAALDVWIAGTYMLQAKDPIRRDIMKMRTKLRSQWKAKYEQQK